MKDSAIITRRRNLPSDCFLYLCELIHTLLITIIIHNQSFLYYMINSDIEMIGCIFLPISIGVTFKYQIHGELPIQTLQQ